MTRLSPARFRQPVTRAGSATITILLPNQDAEVWLEDAPTLERGLERVFHTPGLHQVCNCTIRANWDDNGRTLCRQCRVRLEPGQRVIVDFRANSE